MQCPHCHTENPDSASFCLNCGTRLIRRCPQCGTELPPPARFCLNCGAPVAAPSPAAPQTPSLADALSAALQRLIPPEYARRLQATRGKVSSERRLVTILCSDVKGFTAMSEQLDPEEVAEIMEGAFAVLVSPVCRHEGAVARMMGDAIMALFGAPIAHEDDPERACRAALEIIAGMREYSSHLERERGIHGFQVRVGLHTGLVVVGEVGVDVRTEYTAVGEAVKLASRLEQAAPVGGILISHDTYRHVRGLFEVQMADPVDFQGKTVPACLLLQARPRAFRVVTRGVEGIETRMVGREVESRALQEAWRAVTERGEVRRVTVVGEAGVGKSRLLREFEGWLETQPGPRAVLRSRAVPELTGTPYGVLRGLLAERFGIVESDGAEAVREKFVAGIGAYLNAERACLVGHLVGFDFSATEAVHNLSGSSTGAALAQAYLFNYFRGLAADQAVVLLLEDLHWADNSSLDWISQLVEEMAGRPVLIVGLTRPALYERRPDLAPVPPAGEEKGEMVIRLAPLSPADTRALVQEILQKVDDLPADLRDLIVRSAEGNPFYVEELIKMFIEDGVVVRGEERWRVEMDRLKAVRVPPTLTGVLQARLDSLPLPEKEVLQRAAVVGRQFWDTILAELDAEAPAGDLATSLEAVQRREMIFPLDRKVFAGAQNYTFKHAVLRDVAYETVLRKVRQVYHRRVAEWLEAHTGDRVREYAGLIANHYEWAGAGDQAAVWLRRAGRAAWESCAFTETIDAYERALALTPEGEAGRAALLAALANAYEKRGDYAAAHERLHQALELAHREGDLIAMVDALCGLGFIAQVRGDYAEKRARAEEALEVARRSGDPASLAQALMEMAGSQGNPAEAFRNYREALALFEQAGLRLQIAVCFLNLGNLAYDQRDWTMAARYYEQGLAIFRETGNTWGIGNCLANLGLVAYWHGDYPEAQRLCEEAWTVSQEIGDRENVAIVLNNLGHIAARMGRPDQAMRRFRAALPEAQAIGAVPLELDILIGIAYLRAQAGRFARAAELAGLALGHPAKDAELEMFAEPVLEAVRTALTSQEIEAAMERGRALDLETTLGMECGSNCCAGRTTRAATNLEV